MKWTKISRFSFHPCMNSSDTRVLFVSSSFHTRHKFKDKLIKNFKTVAGEH